MRKTKKHKRQIIILSIVTALAIAAAIAIPLILSKGASEVRGSAQNTQTPMQATTKPGHIKESERPQETERKIVTGTDGIMNDETPAYGTVRINGSLTDAMQDMEKQDALFFVRISTNFWTKGLFTYKGKTVEQWRADPALIAFDEPFDDWNENVFKPYDREMSAAEERGAEHAQGWEKNGEGGPVYEEYWYDTHTDEEIEAYEIASENYEEALDAYSEWRYSDAFTDALSEVKEAECVRLVNLGYDLEFVDNQIRGLLTRAQIEQFPVSDEFGYTIMWADKEGLVDE